MGVPSPLLYRVVKDFTLVNKSTIVPKGTLVALDFDGSGRLESGEQVPLRILLSCRWVEAIPAVKASVESPLPKTRFQRIVA